VLFNRYKGEKKCAVFTGTRIRSKQGKRRKRRRQGKRGKRIGLQNYGSRAILCMEEMVLLKTVKVM
jgi:hypothetical protein